MSSARGLDETANGCRPRQTHTRTQKGPERAEIRQPADRGRVRAACRARSNPKQDKAERDITGDWTTKPETRWAAQRRNSEKNVGGTNMQFRRPTQRLYGPGGGLAVCLIGLFLAPSLFHANDYYVHVYAGAIARLCSAQPGKHDPPLASM